MYDCKKPCCRSQHGFLFAGKQPVPASEELSWMKTKGKTVEQLKKYHRRTFWIITWGMIFAAAAVSAGIFWSLDRAAAVVGTGSQNTQVLDSIPLMVTLLRDDFLMWGLPAVFGVFLVSGWILWLLLRMGTAGLRPEKAALETPEKSSGRSGKKDFLDQKIEQERRQRLFLHTLSVLQREGRLLDFFDEDLKQYSDEQIGAAVRSIQADCKQTVKKYIDPRPVVAGDEGDAITVEAGFDMNAVTLVGNVAGDPPFQGIIKHRGWKAGRKEIPRLADIQDPTVITPAEIEVKARD
jgi:hypothetical protein